MRGGHAARLRDVAQVANVSVATVSRHLNGTLNLPAGTSARIAAAIRDLNYKPNPHARRLSLGRSDMLGLVIPDIANPFFAELAAAVEEGAGANGLGLVLCVTRHCVERELEYLAHMRRNLVDGLLLVTGHGASEALARTINAEHGVVLLDEDIAGSHAPKVFADNRGGGRLAARHLIAAGHRRLGFVGGPDGMFSTVERRAGFLAEIHAAGAGCHLAFETSGEYTIQHGRAAAARLLGAEARPTALFVASDEITLGLLGELRAHGIAVPGEISIVTFDDVGPLHLLQPPLTAIRQPIAEMGQQGVDLLIARLRGGAAPCQPLQLPVQLVERGSVAAPPAPRRAAAQPDHTQTRRAGS